MEQRLMTQDEIAEKYDTDQGTVSLALSAAKIFSRGKTGEKHGKKLYPEGDAVNALIGIYHLRMLRAEDNMRKWQAKEEEIRNTYEEEAGPWMRQWP